MNAQVHDTLAVRVEVVLEVEVGAAERVGHAGDTLGHVAQRLLLRHWRAHVNRAVAGQVLQVACGAAHGSDLSAKYRCCGVGVRVVFETRRIGVSFGCVDVKQ